MIREAAVTFNDLVAARFDNYQLDFWSAFTTPAGKQVGYLNMIGMTDDLITPRKVLPAKTLNLPLPFFYSRDSGVALPTAALPYNDMRIQFSIRNYYELLVAWDYITFLDTNETIVVSRVPVLADFGTTLPELSSVQVWANYAIVSNDERKLMGQAPRDLLIEQVQTNNPQSVDGTRNSTRIDIHFSHSVKALFFSLQNTTNKAEWANYSSASPVPTPAGVSFHPAAASDALANVSVYYENTQRLSNMPVDYFSLIQPYYRAPAIPEETGYHLYAYTLDLMDINPHGSTNYGKLTNVGVEFAPSAEAQQGAASVGTLSVPDVTANIVAGQGLKQSFSFVLVAVNHNIVRIAGGALGFPVL
jgi:hypothetical protein